MDIVLRAALAFGFIFFLTRVVGRRELSSLEPFDLIMLIVLGDLVQQGVTQSDYSVTGLVLAAGTIALMQVGVSYVNFRFKRMRTVLEGEPIVLIEDGRVLERNVHRERMTRHELEEQARLSQIASLDDVRWAVLETSGQISFIPKK
ncbi:MAG TPA: YetF domain-containing protein [Gaiellaceae bacterium]|nr:YetF domain-containing protein [Gaiellaceae bacterium]